MEPWDYDRNSKYRQLDDGTRMRHGPRPIPKRFTRTAAQPEDWFGQPVPAGEPMLGVLRLAGPLLHLWQGVRQYSGCNDIDSAQGCFMKDVAQTSQENNNAPR